MREGKSTGRKKMYQWPQFRIPVSNRHFFSRSPFNITMSFRRMAIINTSLLLAQCSKTSTQGLDAVLDLDPSNTLANTRNQRTPDLISRYDARKLTQPKATHLDGFEAADTIQHLSSDSDTEDVIKAEVELKLHIDLQNHEEIFVSSTSLPKSKLPVTPPSTPTRIESSYFSTLSLAQLQSMIHSSYPGNATR